eukprot:TRINITY_DN7161_c0_g1_i1.p1 TRINITY_DN7161_c0_g1~~TRINITY_DN7161_c0_g1_i1.p1  ORF type:complete len:562 (-),score=134.10 TRINITY_DN7161_c0_g1_i1:61-1746(-)
MESSEPFTELATRSLGFLKSLQLIKWIAQMAHTTEDQLLHRSQLFLQLLRSTIKDLSKMKKHIDREVRSESIEQCLREDKSLTLLGDLVVAKILLVEESIFTTLRLARSLFDGELKDRELQSSKLDLSFEKAGEAVKEFILHSMEFQKALPPFVPPNIMGGAYISSFIAEKRGTMLGRDLPVLYVGEKAEVDEEKQEEEGSGTEASSEVGIELFNKKFKDGVSYIVREGIVENNPSSIAQFLVLHNDVLNKNELGELLGGTSDKDVEITREFTSLLDFSTKTLVQGLRLYLSTFMLPGEAQKISRLMEIFAAEYLRQNPGVFPHEDVAFVLSFSLIMLNTDAHNPAILPKDKMTKEQFIRNNRNTWIDGQDPPSELLVSLYDEIVENEIKITTQGEPTKAGWVKSVHGGGVKEGRTWLILDGNRLSWMKEMPGKGEQLKEDLAGIDLDYVQIKAEKRKAKFFISSALPRDVDFFTLKKGKLTRVSASKLAITCETAESAEAWAVKVRESVSFDNLAELEKKVEKPGSADNIVGLPPIMPPKNLENSWRIKYSQPRTFERPS